ncbi:MAG TPA: hypothetical protein VLD37_03905 [Candidatus Bilamarchaeum sp.]|nr:hypothetical protein [Candidatus Bilamarchaeum sp.]
MVSRFPHVPPRFRALVESYLQRECHPEISRAFRGQPLQEETITGTPTLSDLRNEPRMAAIISSSSDLLITEHLSSIKGVTVAMKVVATAKDGELVAVCRWNAGLGVSFTSYGRGFGPC